MDAHEVRNVIFICVFSREMCVTTGDVIALSDESHVIILTPWIIVGCLIGSFVLLLHIGGGDLVRSRCVCVHGISLCV